MKQMKSVADFKRLVQVGTVIESIFHMVFKGRGEENKPIYENGPMLTRTISIRQTNSFAIKTLKGEKWEDSWCTYPKASECEFKDNRIIIYETNNQGRFPVLTYWFPE